jgi:hypothetical protein
MCLHWFGFVVCPNFYRSFRPTLVLVLDPPQLYECMHMQQPLTTLAGRAESSHQLPYQIMYNLSCLKIRWSKNECWNWKSVDHSGS